MKLYWNFLGEGGGGCKTKNLLWGEYGYFLELLNAMGESNKKIVCCVFLGYTPAVMFG